MIPFRTVMLSAALGLAASTVAQEPAPTPAPTPRPPVAEQPSAAKNVERLIRELGNDSYRTRLDAEKQLRELGDAAVPSLQEAAKGDDAEVQWRARRLLRQIEKGDQDVVERADRGERTERDDQGARAQDPDPNDPRGARQMDRMRRQFESLFERFERDFGIDVPRQRFFDDNFFRDLEEQMRGGTDGSQAMSVQVGPDGVRVEVQQKNDKGETETKVYEAPDMETFQRQHPGVLQKGGLSFALPWTRNGRDNSFRYFITPMDRDTTFDWNGQLQPRVLPFPQAQAQAPVEIDVAPPAPPPAGRRLGVQIRPEITPELRQYLELDDGVGLWVEGVQEGTLAESLGLQAGDIVVKIGGRTIGSAKDVQEALGTIAKGAQVDVEFVRKGAVKTASAKKAEDAAAEPAPEKKTPRVEKRPARSDETIR